MAKRNGKIQIEIDRAYKCDTCRWYGGFFKPDSAHLCNAPDDKGCIMDLRKTKCRYYVPKWGDSK